MTGTWTEFSASQLSAIDSQESLDAMVLLSNGVVLGHTTIDQYDEDPATTGCTLGTTTAPCSGTRWYQLSPDRYGKYDNSSWSRYVPGSSTTLLNPGYQERDLFSSQVLPDGRVVVFGGEIWDPKQGLTGLANLSYGLYNSSNYAEIYDPTSNSWSGVPAPTFPGSNTFEAAAVPVEILPTDTTHNQAQVLVEDALFDHTTNKWVAGTHILSVQLGTTTTSWTTGGTPLGDSGPEDSWVLTAGNGSNNQIASIDTNTPDYESTNNTAEYYTYATNTWTNKASLTQPLSDCSKGPCEIGPAVRVPSLGKAWFLGAIGNTATSPGTTEYFNESNSWSVGPTLPYLDPVLGTFIHGDYPAAVLPNGHVLFLVGNSSGVITTDEFNPDTGTFAAASLPGDVNSNLSNFGNLYTRMLVLPTGQVLLSTTYHVDGGCSPCTQQEQVYLYTPDGAPQASWKPHIGDLFSPNNGVYTLPGTQFNGVSEGGAFGDDGGASTNYPIVRLTKTPSAGRVYYGRTHDWDHTGVATGSTTVSTQFDLPSGIVAGTYTVEVIANGIVSDNSKSLVVGGSVPPPSGSDGKHAASDLARDLAPARSNTAPAAAGLSSLEIIGERQESRPATAPVPARGAQALPPVPVRATQRAGGPGQTRTLDRWVEPADVLASWGLFPEAALTGTPEPG